MKSILVPIVQLYQILDHNLEMTLIVLRRLKSRHNRIVLASNNEISSYPELKSAIEKLLRYQTKIYSFVLHPSLNDSHYLDTLINRFHARLNVDNHALLINPPTLKYYATGDPKYLTQINSKFDLNAYLNTQSGDSNVY